MPRLTLIQPDGERLQFAHTEDPAMTQECGLKAFRGSLSRMQTAYEMRDEADFGARFNEVAAVASSALDLSIVTDGADRAFADAILDELKAWIAQQPDRQAWNNRFHVAMDRECEEQTAT